jgi:transposase
MNPTIFPPIPMDTARAARSVFGQSNFYIEVGDQADRLFDELRLETVPGRDQHRSRTRAWHHLITIFQYMEALPDHLVPGALRDRLDWKYALHLSLGYAQLKALALCEFRQQLLIDQTGRQYFQVLLARLSSNTQTSGNLLTNLQAYQVIGRVCLISRVATTWETINQALEALAIRQPEWLLDNSLPYWFERYDPIHKNLNLSADEYQLSEWAQAFGLDGAYLLKTITESKLEALTEIPEIIHLKQVWQEQYHQIGEQILWRQPVCAGCKLTHYKGNSIPQ